MKIKLNQRAIHAQQIIQELAEAGEYKLAYRFYAVYVKTEWRSAMKARHNRIARKLLEENAAVMQDVEVFIAMKDLKDL